MKENVQLNDVMRFARENAVRVVLRGSVSLAFVVGLTALYHAFAPRSESYMVEVQIALGSQDGKLAYPNGNRFGYSDIVSTPVLTRVWKKYGFDDADVEFGKFCGWFSIDCIDRDRKKLDVEYEGKLGKRNITASEMTSIQREYEAKVSALSPRRLVLTMKPKVLIDRETASAIVNDVPEIWYSEYSRTRAPSIPSAVHADAIRGYVERLGSGDGRTLELIDAIRAYIRELHGTCAFIRGSMLRGRNTLLGEEDIGAYESQLRLYSQEILRLKHQLQTFGSEADLGGYVAARIDSIACEKLESTEKITAVRSSLERMTDTHRQTVEGDAETVADKSGFFSDFATMIRRDANLGMLHKYAIELTDYRKGTADIAARELYYDQILRYMKNRKAKPATSEETDQFMKDVHVMTDGLLDVGRKVREIRDRSMDVYRTSDQYYSISDEVAFKKEYAVPIKILAAGLLGLWFLYNMLGLVRLWLCEFKH